MGKLSVNHIASCS